MKLIYLDDDQDDIGFFIQVAASLTNLERTDCTSDPLEFFDLLSKIEPEKALIFLDINMPENGFDILKKIRTRKDWEHIPVIMLSTSSDNISISMSKLLGATHYCVKPDSLAKLKAIIERVLRAYNNNANKGSLLFRIG